MMMDKTIHILILLIQLFTLTAQRQQGYSTERSIDHSRRLTEPDPFPCLTNDKDVHAVAYREADPLFVSFSEPLLTKTERSCTFPDAAEVRG